MFGQSTFTTSQLLRQVLPPIVLETLGLISLSLEGQIPFFFCSLSPLQQLFLINASSSIKVRNLGWISRNSLLTDLLLSAHLQSRDNQCTLNTRMTQSLSPSSASLQSLHGSFFTKVITKKNSKNTQRKRRLSLHYFEES